MTCALTGAAFRFGRLFVLTLQASSSAQAGGRSGALGVDGGDGEEEALGVG